jgi:hypothetical protein
MAREIVVTLGEATSSFAFAKVDRSKLYGRRRRVPLDPEGNACEKGGLTSDGALLIRPGMTGQGYFDADNYWYPTADLLSLDAEGNAAERVTSTLGVAQDLTEVAPQALLDVRVQSIYMLDASDLDEALETALKAGSVFTFNFAYRTGYKCDQGFLLTNKEGTFALVGQSVTPIWCELDAVPVEDFSDDDGGFDDDLDFEMF